MPKYIRTVSGTKFRTKPGIEDFNLTDIAHGLAIAPRWGAQSKWRYPVAAHVIYVAHMLPNFFKFDGLMHDTSEAYFCDLPSPFKWAMPEYKAIEHGIMQAASRAFNFCWPPPPLVKLADAIALQNEHLAFFGNEFLDDVPRIDVPAELEVPTDWDFSAWENMPVALIKHTFVNHFNEYRQLM